MDFDKLGRRIAEERKSLRKVSQEKMAEDLGLYQADISNLEHNRKGSGITDLTRLEMIADYFDIPLQSLLFGTSKESEMVKYYGKKMSIKAVPPKKAFNTHHKKTLAMITGQDAENITAERFQCGPYSLYVMVESQIEFGNDPETNQPAPQFVLHKPHAFVFYGIELIATLVSSHIKILYLLCQATFPALQTAILPEVLDVTDALRVLNPFFPFAQFESDPVKVQQYCDMTYKRFEALRPVSDESLFFLESIYVREDFRNLGVCRMMLDLLETVYGQFSAWLNMEPTTGAELYNEVDYTPTYTVAEVGQLSLNAAIAEKLGFIVDPDCWHREVETVNSSGDSELKVLEVRKCAYRLTATVQSIIENDGDLVAQGRALQKLVQSNDDDSRADSTDLRSGRINNNPVSELTVRSRGKTRYISAEQKADGNYHFTVSTDSIFTKGETRTLLEEYDWLDDALESSYFDNFMLLTSHLEYFARAAQPEEDAES